MLTGFPEGLLLSFNVKPRVLTAFTSEVVESFVFAFVGLVYVLWVLCPGFLWVRFGLGFYAFHTLRGACACALFYACFTGFMCFMVFYVLCFYLCVLWVF
jgi:hypothetical protein